MGEESNFVKIPKFLKRLFRETSDQENPNIVWSEDGLRVRIVNKNFFIIDTLPSLAKTKEYSAFIRQLNIYGFVKVKNEKNDEIEEYYNCYFKKDNPQLLGFIKRVMKANKLDTKVHLPTIENNISFLTNSNFKLASEVSQLKERVDKQERTINGLLDILGRVFRTGAQNMGFEPMQNKARAENYSSYPFEKQLIYLEDSNKFKNNFYSNNILAQKDEDVKKKDKDNFMGDMSDIFF